MRVSRDLRKNQIRIAQIKDIGYQIGALIGEKDIITAENLGALMISYSEIGGHVLTPFLGTCL